MGGSAAEQNSQWTIVSSHISITALSRLIIPAMPLTSPVLHKEYYTVQVNHLLYSDYSL